MLERTFETTARRVLGWCFALYRPVRGIAGAAVLAVYVAMVAGVVVVFPMSNWDMAAYTAVLLEDKAADKATLHRESWDAVRDNVSAGEFMVLTGDRPYRIRQYEDPDAFFTMLSFYRMKILYTETAKLLADFMDPVKALRLVSILSAVAAGLVLLAWLADRRALAYGPVLAAFLVLAGFGEAAALVTPDLYASVFLLLAALLYLKKLDVLSAVALVLAFLVRPDNLAFIGVFFVFAWIYGEARIAMTLAFVATAVGYLFVVTDSSHPGWWAHLWFSHIEYVPTLEGFSPKFSVLVYLEILMRATVRSLMSQTWLACLFGLVVFFAAAIDPDRLVRRDKVLLYAVATSIFAKYLVFPHYETRFYLPYLTILAVVSLTGFAAQTARDQASATARSTSATSPGSSASRAASMAR